MMSFSSRCATMFFLILLALPSCTKKTAHLFKHDSTTYTERRDSVVISMTRLSAAESCKKFGRNLIKHGYQPYTIAITNESDDQLFFRASSIDLPLAGIHDIYTHIHYSAVGLTIAPFYLAALFAWPLVFPVVGAGVWIAMRNKQVQDTINEEFFGQDKALEILPFERITRTFFISVFDRKDQFSLHVFKRNAKIFVPFTIRL